MAGSFPGSCPKHPEKLGNLLKALERYSAAGRAKSGERDQAEYTEGEMQSRAEQSLVRGRHLLGRVCRGCTVRTQTPVHISGRKTSEWKNGPGGSVTRGHPVPKKQMEKALTP